MITSAIISSIRVKPFGLTSLSSQFVFKA